MLITVSADNSRSKPADAELEPMSNLNIMNTEEIIIDGEDCETDFGPESSFDYVGEKAELLWTLVFYLTP